MWLARVLAVAVCLLIAASPAFADKRVALLIGNAGYAAVAALANPPKDIALLKTAFEAAGFDNVETLSDLSREAMVKALRAFEDEAANADIAVVYYSGHGLEVAGENYLVPVDAVLASDRDVKDETVPLDRVLDALDGARRLKLVILDACRSNPFIPKMAASGRSRAISRGLARIEPSSADTLIAYAAKAGTEASDGDGANSPFAAALARRLTEPGVDVQFALRQVRDDVLAATDRRQEPFVYGSLGGTLTPLSKLVAPALPAPIIEAKAPSPVAPTAPGRDFATALADGYSWGPAPGRAYEMTPLAVSPDGRLMVSGTDEPALKVWDLEQGRETRTISGLPLPILSLSVSQSGEMVAITFNGRDAPGADKPTQVWDLEQGRRLRTYPDSAEGPMVVAFNPLQDLLAIGEANGTVLRDYAVGSDLGRFGKDIVTAVAFSHDGSVLATGGSPSGSAPKVEVWDITSHKKLQTFAPHYAGPVLLIAAIAFSPDGALLASVTDPESIVRLWDMQSGRLVRTLKGHTGEVLAVAFSPDGKSVATGSRDGTARLWDAATGKPVKTLSGGGSWVESVAFLPDGKRLVTGGDKARLWDVNSGAMLREFHALRGGSLVFDGNGALTAVSGPEDALYRFEKDGRTVKPSELRRLGYAIPEDRTR